MTDSDITTTDTNTTTTNMNCNYEGVLITTTFLGAVLGRHLAKTGIVLSAAMMPSAGIGFAAITFGGYTGRTWENDCKLLNKHFGFEVASAMLGGIIGGNYGAAVGVVAAFVGDNLIEMYYDFMHPNL